jgi:hypothetical protein
MPIKEEIWAKAIDDIIRRTDGEIERMTVSDLIVMKMIAENTIHLFRDKRTRRYLQNWIDLDVEKWLDSKDALMDEIRAIRSINMTLV